MARTQKEKERKRLYEMGPGKDLRKTARALRNQTAKGIAKRKEEQFLRKTRPGYLRTGYETRVRKTYGATLEDIARLFEAQQGKCGSCSEILRWDKQTHIDHDHATQKLRGLLCERCNHVLGKVRDSIGVLEKLIQYLQQS